ncbi:MAG: hypothetical protein GY739_04060 [Mesoflavibacter sp.]|nr:hypothetical protein [Mesoflavibacter sp.]
MKNDLISKDLADTILMRGYKATQELGERIMNIMLKEQEVEDVPGRVPADADEDDMSSVDEPEKEKDDTESTSSLEPEKEKNESKHIYRFLRILACCAI